MSKPTWSAVFVGTMLVGSLTGVLIKGSRLIAIGDWFWQIFALTIVLLLWASSRNAESGKFLKPLQTVFLWPPLMCFGAFFLDVIQSLPESKAIESWMWLSMRMFSWASIPILVVGALWMLRPRQPASVIEPK